MNCSAMPTTSTATVRQALSWDLMVPKAVERPQVVRSGANGRDGLARRAAVQTEPDGPFSRPQKALAVDAHEGPFDAAPGQAFSRKERPDAEKRGEREGSRHGERRRRPTSDHVGQGEGPGCRRQDDQQRLEVAVRRTEHKRTWTREG